MAIIDREDPEQYQAAKGIMIQYLNEAHATERALVTTLGAHLSMTPRGPYRRLLERHLRETRSHAAAIAERLAALGGSAGLLTVTIGAAETVIGQVLSLAKGPLDLLRGHGGEEKLLKNAKDECATEALEIATYDTLEALAQAIGDTATVELAVAHRADEERMLADLRALIPELTRAAVAARAGGEPSYDPATTGAADAVRGKAAEPELPIADYAGQNAGQIVAQLSDLSQAQLATVLAYERGRRNRRTIVERAQALTADPPWAGYDDADAAEILARLNEAIAGTVRDYESRHRRRVTVLEAAQRELSRS
jgi:ferritin-like metal-binding protein YciE